MPDTDVYITRAFNAPSDVVWKFLTEPELLAQWFGPHDGAHRPVDRQGRAAPRRALGPRHGRQRDRRALPGALEAHASSWSPSTSRAARSAAPARDGPADAIVLRIWFHDHGDKTRMTLHQGPFTAEFRDMTPDGWEESFLKIDAIVRGAQKAAPDAVARPSTRSPTDGTRIAFERAGAGPVLVLVDGAMVYREFGGGRADHRRRCATATRSSSTTVAVAGRAATRPLPPEREIDDLRAVIDGRRRRRRRARPVIRCRPRLPRGRGRRADGEADRLRGALRRRLARAAATTSPNSTG